MAEDIPSARRRELIDENLKRAYDEALKQDIPDRFKDLLAQLKQGTAPPKKAEDK